MDLGFEIIKYNNKGYTTKMIMTEKEFSRREFSNADLILKKKDKIYLLERAIDVEYKKIKEDN